MPIEIRRATAGDAEAVRDIVLRALRETNARDYPASVIDRLALTLPDKVASNLETWRAFVAIIDGRIVGTASLNGETVSSVYVCPDHQRRGVGAKLMDAVENVANAGARRTLTVQSSITAEAFYARRGFRLMNEGSFGEERTIMMAKDISGPSE
jgi:GNAT superfamily N-acetyltransferase